MEKRSAFYKVGDVVMYWEKNQYGYNLCHKGTIEQIFDSDSMAYIRNIKDHREYVVECRNIERVVE
jgi:hypothetical protein